MNSSGNLCGTWKLIREGSDFLPGLDALVGSPHILKISGNSDTEFLSIEKSNSYESEAVTMKYVTNRGTSIFCSYQLGCLNFVNSLSSDITFSILQNCDEEFTQFAITTLGPKCGQRSQEVYKFNSKTNELNLRLDITTTDGIHLTLMRYFCRYDDAVPTNQIAFNHWKKTLGWSKHDFWPSSVLTECNVLIVKVVKLQMTSYFSKQKPAQVETVWKLEAFHDNFELDIGSIPRTHGYRESDSEEILVYVVQVTCQESVWYVAHRYRDFDILKNFFILQNPFNSDFRTAEANFPGKQLGLSYFKSAFETRLKGLGTFLVYFVQNARYCRQNSVDALCSFLQIPEHIGKWEKPTPPPVSAPKVQSKMIFGTSKTASATTSSTTKSTASSNQPVVAEKINEHTTATAANNAVSCASVVSDETKEAQESISVETKPTKPVKRTSFIFSRNNEKSAVPTTDDTDAAFAALSAKEKLHHTLLSKGIRVIKHDRKPGTKRKVLRADPSFSILYWDTEKKCIPLAGVESIRVGTEIDLVDTPAYLLEEMGLSRPGDGSSSSASPLQQQPATPTTAPLASTSGSVDEDGSPSTPTSPESSTNRTGRSASVTFAAGTNNESARRDSDDMSVTSTASRQPLSRRFSKRFSLGGKLKVHQDTPNVVLYGTNVLRRDCSPDQMELCFSLIMKDRTYDFECYSTEDYNLFVAGLKERCQC